MKVADISIRIFGTILAIVLGLILVLTLISYSTSANRLLLQGISDRIPQLNISKVTGSLATELGFDLRYEDESVQVQLESTELNIRPGCLWQLAVCIRSFTVESIDVTLKDSETTSDQEPLQLPKISIPISVSLNHLSIQHLRIREQDELLYQASAIQLAADAIHHRISLHSMQAQDEYCTWQADSTIRLTRRYPLDTTLQCISERYPFSKVTAKAAGDLDRLTIKAKTQGELNSNIQLELSPLADKLPFQATLSLLSPFAYQMDQDAITLNSANVRAEGNLESVAVNTQAEFSSSLFPSPVNSSSEMTATLSQLDIKTLRLQLPEGNINTQGKLVFNPLLTWQAESQLDTVALAPFAEQLQGYVNGTILHQGELADDVLHAQFNLDQLTGVLFESPWQLDGSVNLDDEKITLTNLDIKQERNRAQANGTLSLTGENDLQLTLNLEALSKVLPDLKGALSADLNLKGTIQQPTIRGMIEATNIQYQEFKLRQAAGDIDWRPLSERHNTLHLQLTGLDIADQLSIDGNLDLSGNAERHSAYLQIQEQEGNRLTLQCTGGFPMSASRINMDQWEADCTRSTFEVAYMETPQTWTLQQPFKVKVTDLQQAQISPFCYTLNGSTLCLRQPITTSSDTVSTLLVKGDQLYLSWLRPWLPEGMDLDGRVDLNAEITLQPELSVSAKVTSRDAQLTLFDSQSHSISLQLEQTVLNASLKGNQGNIDWQIQSDAGSSQGNIAMLDNKLSGAVTLQDVNIEPFSRWLLEEEGDHIKGLVAGDFKLSGDLTSPLLEGQATLDQGEIHTIMLPLPIENIRITLSTRQRIAKLNGHFTVNNKPGRLEGEFNWQQTDWWSKVSFHSDTLAYRPSEDILIYVKPDIVFNLTPSSLDITGDILVPKARILLKTLPEQAISSSSDTIIVDQDEADSNELDISTRLNLTLGEDVRFKGYGLETDLTGNMIISQKESDLLRAKGIIRLKNGTYQAYGQSLSITDGDLIFIDELDNPQLRLSATRDNISDNVVVGIRVTGRAQTPEITIYSIPEMPQQEKFHYLITGRAPNTDPNQDSSSVAAEAALSLALESRSGFTRKAGEKLGIKDLTLSTGSTENRSEVGLSGYITSDLMIRYGVGMFESVNTLTLKYRIRKNLYAEVISGKSNAFDLLWSFDRD